MREGKDMWWTKKRKGCFSAIIIVMLFASWLIIYHPIGGNKFEEEIKTRVLTASVLIIQASTYLPDPSAPPAYAASESAGYSPGASGTIIKKEGDRYYVLTAYHVVEPEKDADRTEILIADYNDEGELDPDKYQAYQDLEGFYGRFSKARMEFFDQQSDLAVISFTSKENYSTIQVAKSSPKLGSIVGTLSNPWDANRNDVAVGRVISRYSTKSSMKFYNTKYHLLTHTAKTGVGSSGGMMLNEDLQLVGVTIGGTEIKILAFQFFLAGKSMPCDRIQEFFAENGFVT